MSLTKIRVVALTVADGIATGSIVKVFDTLLQIRLPLDEPAQMLTVDETYAVLHEEGVPDFTLTALGNKTYDLTQQLRDHAFLLFPDLVSKKGLGSSLDEIIGEFDDVYEEITILIQPFQWNWPDRLRRS